jgi:hypothetical protein
VLDKEILLSGIKLPRESAVHGSLGPPDRKLIFGVYDAVKRIAVMGGWPWAG